MTQLTALPPGSTLGLLTSGGDAPGMNAAVRTGTKVALARGLRVLGIERGYQGLLDRSVRELGHRDVDRIARFGGTMLGSARELRLKTAAGRRLAQESVRALGLDALLVIGGDGSLTGARALSSLVGASGTPLRVMGVPASIDNDVGCSSLSIGVDTAINTIVDAVDRIADTAWAHQRTFVVEVMGRDCGYLAMVAGISASADAVLYRESGRSHDEMLRRLEDLVRRAYRDDGKGMVLIVKAEGVTLPSEAIKEHLAAALAEELPGLQTRVAVLGHLVRGGSPTAMDRLVASRLTRCAVLGLLDGRSVQMAAWRPPVGERGPYDPHVGFFDLDAVLEETRRIREGSSPVHQARVKLIQSVESLLSL